jgi:hypothetical protein
MLNGEAITASPFFFIMEGLRQLVEKSQKKGELTY